MMMMSDRGGREGKMMVVEKEGDARKREREKECVRVYERGCC
jgi:hypothetical protein